MHLPVLSLLLAQGDASQPSLLVIALGAVALLLLLLAAYLLTAVVPMLRKRIQELKEEQAQLQDTSRQREAAMRQEKHASDVELQQWKRRVDDLHAEMESMPDAAATVRRLVDEKLANHVQRRCCQRLEERIRVEATRHAEDAEMIRTLHGKVESLSRQLQAAGLNQHVQTRLQARLESNVRAREVEGAAIADQLSNLGGQMATMTESTKRHRSRCRLLEQELKRAHHRLRVQQASSISRAAAQRADRAKIQTLTAKLEQLQSVAKSVVNTNTTRLHAAERKLKNLRRWLAK